MAALLNDFQLISTETEIFGLHMYNRHSEISYFRKLCLSLNPYLADMLANFLGASTDSSLAVEK